MKYLAQVLLPAVGTLYFAVAGIWNLPSAQEVVGTIVAVDTFLGLLLHLSSNAYENSDAKFDGTLLVQPNSSNPGEGFVNVGLKNHPDEVAKKKDEVRLKVVSS
jgi:hypothetical protein